MFKERGKAAQKKEEAEAVKFLCRSRKSTEKRRRGGEGTHDLFLYQKRAVEGKLWWGKEEGCTIVQHGRVQPASKKEGNTASLTIHHQSWNYEQKKKKKEAVDGKGKSDRT